MITELIAFELREGISNDSLIRQADTVINDFHRKQEGYIDMELVSGTSDSTWQMILHYRSMEDIEKVKNNIPHSDAIKDLTEMLKPGSLQVSFYENRGKWE
jgi:hypothetical protein